MQNKWRTIAELFAAISVVLSLLFVGYEIRLSRNVAANDSAASAAEIDTTVREYASQYPSILARGCLNQELSEDDEIVFSNLVQTFDRLAFFRFVRSSTGISGVSTDFHARTVAKNRVNFPGFNRKWLEIREVEIGYESWYELVDEWYSELMEQNVGSLLDASTCGF